MPTRITKGSTDAIEWGKNMRALRKANSDKKNVGGEIVDGGELIETKTRPAAATEAADEQTTPPTKRKPSRLEKGSIEAKEHMAKIRAMRKQKQ